MNGFEARLRALEDDLEKRLTGIEADAERRERVQESRHAGVEANTARLERVQESRHVENSLRLKKIEDAFLETAVYFKVGRWVMTVVSVIGTAIITALATKWLGAKP